LDYDKVSNINYIFKLIYRTSRDGNTIAAFHEKCVRCIIKYEERNLVYWVYFGEAFQYHIKSEKSSSDAANLYVKVHTYNDLLLIVKFLNFINAKSNFLK